MSWCFLSCGSCLDPQNVQEHGKISERCLDVTGLSDLHLWSSSYEYCEDNMGYGIKQDSTASEVWHVYSFKC